MPQKDHYVSQTYLNAFTNESSLLVPYYKNGRVIIGNFKSTKSVCCEQDGDVNSFFKDSRIIDEFLSLFENHWATHIHALGNMKGDQDTKYGIAGYISFLKSCNPTAKRLGQDLVTNSMQPHIDKIMAESVNDQGLSPIARKLYEEGQIKFSVDSDYPHALAITNLVNLTHRIYCSDWLILFNNTNTPFITSDNPAIFYYQKTLSCFGHTFVPLTPKLGILISPNPFFQLEDMQEYVLETDKFSEVKEVFVQELNELIVKSAEKIVIHSERSDWVELLVSNNKTWRVEASETNISMGDGVLSMYRQDAVNKVNT